MSIDRRRFLKTIAAGAVGLAVPGTATTSEATRSPPPDTLAMLYDSTRCIGCRACMAACRRANGLPPETVHIGGAAYDAPTDLSSRTKTIIKLYDTGTRRGFVKRQCMHCLKPACVSVCMLGALHKSEGGIVAYDKDRCIGCRYCQVACPFDVPRFEWDDPTPLIVKCEFCRQRRDGHRQPACCEVCPRQAIVTGRRDELLAEARDRLRRHPERYNPDILGDTEIGGTQVLYLAPRGVTFREMGFPELDDDPVPALSETIQHGIYRGFISPVVLYVTLGAVLWRHRRRGNADTEEGDDA